MWIVGQVWKPPAIPSLERQKQGSPKANWLPRVDRNESWVQQDTHPDSLSKAETKMPSIDFRHMHPQRCASQHANMYKYMRTCHTERGLDYLLLERWEAHNRSMNEALLFYSYFYFFVGMVTHVFNSSTQETEEKRGKEGLLRPTWKFSHF